MKKKKLYLILGIIIILIILLTIILLRIGIGQNSGEDNWIQDSNGIWVKHGNPAITPSYVLEEQDALSCANDLYSQAKVNGMVFSSQCLGACGSYSVDIVHVPRNSEDNLAQNQCSDYPNTTPYFIELDQDGDVIRVV